jgi:hypothetical protein
MSDTILPKAPPPTELTSAKAGDKALAGVAGDQAESLAGKANLAGVDHGSFTKAQNDFAAGNTAGDHLPALALPYALDKNLLAAHDNLGAAVDSAISDPQTRQQFHASMDSFEKRAEAGGLTAAQVESTYDQMGRMLQAAPGSPLNHSQRLEAATQWMAHLADPQGTTRQGWHDTCGWTSLEVRLLTMDPEKITGKMAELVTTGGVTTVDVNKAMAMAQDNQTPDALPTKQLKIDPSSLQPDEEEQGVLHHSDDRSYVDQLAQVMLDNIKWDATPFAPDGTRLGSGTMSYGQCSVISRPSDGTPAGTGADASCESVSWVDPKTGQKVIDNANGYGEGGAASPGEVSYVNAIITGNSNPIELVRTDNGPKEEANSILGVGSVDELKSKIQSLHDSNQLPMGAMVEVDHPGIMEDYLARHPEKTAADVPKNSWHLILVTGMDDKGNVQIYNPWGLKRTLTAEQLYAAMSYPK